MQSDEARREMLAEARIFALAAPVLIPLLQQRKKVAMDRLIARHKEGMTDYLTLVSEISVLTDLERDITSKTQIYTTLEEKQHGSANRSNRN